MNIEPIPYEIIDKAKKAGVHTITLNFSGGSDEGYLDITLNEGGLADDSLESEIEEWAWEVYEYSGAGDGNEYGDEIVYDLISMKATITDWHMSRSVGSEYSEPLKVDGEGDKDCEKPESNLDACLDIAKSDLPESILKCLVYWAGMNDDLVSDELRVIVEHAKKVIQS